MGDVVGYLSDQTNIAHVFKLTKFNFIYDVLNFTYSFFIHYNRLHRIESSAKEQCETMELIVNG